MRLSLRVRLRVRLRLRRVHKAKYTSYGSPNVVCASYTFSAEKNFRRQNLKSNPALKELKMYNGHRPIA